MKIALVHDWLTGMRGGERCLEEFLTLYPDADIFTLIHIPGTTRVEFDKKVRGTSFLSKIPGIGKIYRHLLPLFPVASYSLDLEGYDLVISLSHAAVKNVRVPKGVPHICYCFTPMRYIWDQATVYFGRKKAFLFPLIWMLRRWDTYCSKGVTHFIAISALTQHRIKNFYGRDSIVIHPPVDTSWVQNCGGTQTRRKGEAFLYAGAMVPYKKVDLIVKVCTELSLPLWVVGTGPEEKKLQASAGPTIQFFGRVSDEELAQFYSRAKALLFAAREDFGMIPVESMAAGTPVIGFGHGGLLETVNGVFADSGVGTVAAGATGVFASCEKDEIEAFGEALKFFEAHQSSFLPEACTQRAMLFSPDSFRSRWNKFLRGHHLDRFVVADEKERVLREDIGNA